MRGMLIFGLLGIAAVWAVIARLLRRCEGLELQLGQVRKQRRNVIDFLNDFTRKLAAVAEIDEAMQLVAHYLRDMLRAESLAIFVVDVDPRDDRKKLRGSAVAGVFPAFRQTADIVMVRAKYRLEHIRHEYFEIDSGIFGHLTGEDDYVLISEATEDHRRDLLPTGVRTLVAAPMWADRHFVGVICAVNCREEGRSFDEDDLHMLKDLSYQAALASNLVNIYSERTHQERVMQELELGRELQQSLLPERMPEWGDFRVVVYGEPAREVGGDYYDVVQIDEDRLLIVLGDATGKGIPACMLMAMCRSFVRFLIETYTGLDHFLSRLSRRLFMDTDTTHFVTLAVVVLNRATHECECASAGHTPILVKRPDGSTRSVMPGGPAIGLLPPELGSEFHTETFSFDPGTEMLLFTDGITEAQNERGTEFGLPRLESLWKRGSTSPEEMSAMIVREVGLFVGKAPATDDQTMLIISRQLTDQQQQGETSDAV